MRTKGELMAVGKSIRLSIYRDDFRWIPYWMAHTPKDDLERKFFGYKMSIVFCLVGMEIDFTIH